MPQEVAASFGMPAGTAVVVGNLAHIGLGDNTGEPFVVGYIHGVYLIGCSLSDAVSLAITAREVVFHKIQSDYLPEKRIINVTEEEWATESNGLVMMSQFPDWLVDVLRKDEDVVLVIPDDNMTYRCIPYCYSVSTEGGAETATIHTNVWTYGDVRFVFMKQL